jgi:hypothetical protein
MYTYIFCSCFAHFLLIFQVAATSGGVSGRQVDVDIHIWLIFGSLCAPFFRYAYAGGGNRLHRVEISLDDGLTWKFADIKRSEVPTAHYKNWCWVNWEVVLTVKQLLDSPSGRIQCR